MPVLCDEQTRASRRSDGGAPPISSLSEALRESKASEEAGLRQPQSCDSKGGAAPETSLQSIAESNRWEGESEADSSLSVRIG